MINADWKFYKGSAENAAQPEFDDSAWETVCLGHTWNNIDGQDGTAGGSNINETDYYRGDGWYRKWVRFEKTDADKRLFLRFQGANIEAEVFVGGKKAGSHRGGYTAFAVDITPYVDVAKPNLIAVRVNNEKTKEVAPITADFTFYGGLYRETELIKKNRVHFDFGIYGSRGLKIITPTVSLEKATCILEAEVVNTADKDISLCVGAKLYSKSDFAENEFIRNTDFSLADMTGETYADKQCLDLEIPPFGREKVQFAFTVNDPHLWNGREDPFLYTAALEIVCNGKILDSIEDDFGFRFFSVDREKGFFLNGKSYPLRGVSRHQDREGLGNALTKKEHDEDFALFYDMGVTAVRLAHYPQAEYFYRLCDRYGIVVWAEIPFVDEVGGTGSFENPDVSRKAFFETTERQLRELIEQNFNHPAIVCWGLQNEVRAEYDSVMIPFSEYLYAVGKACDPYRLLTQATNQTTAYHWKSDLMAWNVYPGWYGMRRTQLGWFIDKNRCDRPMGISEYGAGGNHTQHEEKPKRPKHDGQWHPEEYQTLCHEAFLKQIDERPYLWATFVWNMFDFGSDGRNEGAHPGMNDKGLVSFDRKVKKDSYYVYQSAWSKHPMVQIGEARNPKRKKSRMKLKVYSNCERVTLYRNDEKIKTLSAKDCRQKGIFVFKLKLQKGQNVLRAEAAENGGTYQSTAEFTYGY